MVGVRPARGHVLVLFLGIGWVAACALRDEVTAAIVVELEQDVRQSTAT